MLGYVVFFSVGASFFCSLLCGNMAELGAAVLDGASSAVELALSLMGMMCLWGGIMRVFSEAGVTDRLARVLAPLFRHVFPDAYEKGYGKREVCSAVCANILGIGNAATPLAISAMQELEKNGKQKGVATESQIALAVLGSCCFCILPTTVISMRHAAGSVQASAITPAVWICSGAGFLLGCLLLSVCAKASRSDILSG